MFGVDAGYPCPASAWSNVLQGLKPASGVSDCAAELLGAVAGHVAGAGVPPTEEPLQAVRAQTSAARPTRVAKERIGPVTL
jgi:hypothetical protein